MKRRKRRFTRTRYVSRKMRDARHALDTYPVRHHYVLGEDGEPVPCRYLGEWVRMFRSGERILAQTEVGDLRVSTVFLGIDHNFGGIFRAEGEEGEYVPILFESMVFRRSAERPWNDLRQRRYATRAQALAGHAEMVTWAEREREQ